MRWRPTLAALGVLAVAAALVVTMNSASVPTAVAADTRVDDTDATLLRSAAPGEEPAGELGDAGGYRTGAAPDGAVPADGTASAVDVDVPAGVGAGPAGVGAAAHSNGAAARQPGDGRVGRAVADRIDGPYDTTTADEGPETAVSPAAPDVVPSICPDPSDPLFALYRPGEDCDWLRFEEELHQGLTDEELALTEVVPFVAGHAAEPLGRPAREIRRGPLGEAGAPRFYLTFDDGPSTRWTLPTLDLLDRYGARATFFPVGAYAEANFHLIEEIVARGHTIGSHLWSHERAALTNEELFRRELRASAELFGELGTNCLRTPFGGISDDILEWAGDEGFEVVLWGEPDPRDWERPGIEELTRSMLDMQNGSILILHEHTGDDTLTALDAVLDALEARGWLFDVPICPLQF